MRSVARPSDITTTVSPPERGRFIDATMGSATGTWKADAVRPVLVRSARSGGEPLVRSVSCTFNFIGKQDAEPHSPVRGSADLKLAATPAVLRVVEESVLCDGDTKSDRFGNTITVASQATWHTA